MNAHEEAPLDDDVGMEHQEEFEDADDDEVGLGGQAVGRGGARARGTARRARGHGGRGAMHASPVGSNAADDDDVQEHDDEVSVVDAHARSEFLNLKKRKLELDIQASQEKLRRIETEREQLDLELRSFDTSRAPRAPPSHTASLLQPGDFAALSQAIATALREGGSSTPNQSQPALLNRLATDKIKLSFSGNNLEFMRFKRAFEHSSDLGQYSDAENVHRLVNCLEGDARRSVESLLMTTNSAIEIMKALERKYGGEDDIILKLVSSIRELPTIDSGKIDFISFASAVKNNVTAMLSFNNSGYLNNIELIRNVLDKLPRAMLYRYNEYVSYLTETANLKTLADFLDREADLSRKAGTACVFSSGGSSKSTGPRFFDNRSTKRVHAINGAGVSRGGNGKACYYCDGKDHLMPKCKQFLDLPATDRWKWAKEKRRCFRCLAPMHASGRPCTAMMCPKAGCGRPHHTLLHYTKASTNNSSATIGSNTSS